MGKERNLILNELQTFVGTPQVTYVGDCKYLIVDENFSNIIQSFDLKSEASKYLLSLHDKGKLAGHHFWICRMPKTEFQNVLYKCKQQVAH